MSTPAVSTNSDMQNALKKVAPGATRSFWHMRCNVNGRVSYTVNIAPENTLKIPPQLMAQQQPGHPTAQAGQVTSAEVDSEEISQVVESSQDLNSAETKTNLLAEGAELAVNGSPLGLSGEQKAVLHMVLNGRNNIFFTGAAGTGKSVLLRCIIRQLRRKYGAPYVGVTALTGIAACNIGGQTLHRFAGIGLGRDSVPELVRRIQWNEATKMRWLDTQVLLIDEVSMLDIELLEKLEEIARLVRGNDIPFGGIQIICTGDLFQLPPVDKKATSEKRFCFETPVWDRLIDRTVNLTRVFRQQDPEFAQILNQLRMGYVSPKSESLFLGLSRPPKLPKGIVPTQLFSTRREVNQANNAALKRLIGTEYVYDCADWKDENRPETKYMDISRDVLAEDRVKLKVGAQVMLIKNIDNTLVNGSIGRVVAFMSPNSTYMDYGSDENNESHFRSRKVSPVNDKTTENDADTERVSKILGAYGNSASARRKRKLAEDMTAEDAKKGAVLPIVKFVTAQNTVRFMMVHPETWEIADADGNPIVSRTQLPVILAWALSIHKSQGQTLPYVSVDLKNIFERGQAYVAISRATCIEGLQVMNFSSRKVQSSPRVVQYYEKLERICDKEIAEAEEYFKEEIRLEEIRKKELQKALETAYNEELKREEEAAAAAAAAAQNRKQKSRKKLADSNVEGPKLEVTENVEYRDASDDLDPEYLPKSENDPDFLPSDHPDINNLISDSEPADVDHIANMICSTDEPTHGLKRRRVIMESSSPMM